MMGKWSSSSHLPACYVIKVVCAAYDPFCSTPTDSLFIAPLLPAFTLQQIEAFVETGK
jgi:hypothetical protein